MYDYIQGTLQTVYTDSLVLDTGGIGYKIFVSKTEKGRFQAPSSTLKLYIDLIIREDAHTLYGFSSIGERDLFRLLLQVNGIGPKVAINIMSSTNAVQLAAALQSKDTKLLSAIPGIGKKLADRLIVELHEKISSLFEPGSTQSNSTPPLSLDACRALETLGLSIHETRDLIAKVHALHPQISTVEGLVQQALILKRSAKQ
jgi:holliday junction DNA helicase RuvA